MSARQGYPDVCARPVASSAGRAALVADVFRKWMQGAPAAAAKDAAVLFSNAENPGDPQVRTILRQLPILEQSS
jgi:pyridoxine/pyridoxamine 5'-phosphate oxidase